MFLFGTPSWVHFDRRAVPAACVSGYPAVREGSRGNYVLTLQDALNTAGYTGGGMDGVFGPGTRAAVERYQRVNSLTADGVVGCATWTAITKQIVGKGPTRTTAAPCGQSL